MLNNSSRLLKDAMTKKIQTYNSASRRREKAVKRRNLEFPWRARNKGPIFLDNRQRSTWLVFNFIRGNGCRGNLKAPCGRQDRAREDLSLLKRRMVVGGIVLNV
jgi:hypothetical protein